MDMRLQSAFTTGYERLSAWGDLLDTINVFPVADADTGSNLMISLAPLHRMDTSTDGAVQKLLVSALGNSGNIACSFFTAFIAADPLRDIYQAAKAGRDKSWAALADPKPGTMLTVFDELLSHFEHASLDQLPTTYPGLIAKLEGAVHSTGETLPVLKAAGVVDAGALGIFLFLEGFFGCLAGRADRFRPVTETFKHGLHLPPDFTPDRSDGHCIDTVVQVKEGADSVLRKLAECGESIVLLREKDRVKIHLHTGRREDIRRQLEDVGRVMQWTEQDMGLVNGQRPQTLHPAAIHVVTDAAGSITRRDAARLGMTLLDSYIIVGDKSLPETLFSPAELYALMRRGVKVRTAQASVFERHQRYESILCRHPAALYLCVGSAYTGNYQAVSAWKERNDPAGRMKVIDTGAASGRLGIAARAIARFTRRVSDLDQVIRFAEAAVLSSQEYIFLDRLQYLAAGGRLSKTKGFLGDMLHMKPIITPAAEGALKVGTVRNKSEQVEFALKKLEQHLGLKAGALILIEYSDNRDWVEEAVMRPIRERHAAAEVVLCPLSLTSGAHMGPGTWGVAFLPAFTDSTQSRRI
jgi:DegV family protein with EDD domain